MKSLVIFVIFLSLVGCSSIDYSAKALSSANVLGLEINEIHNSNNNKLSLEVAFDYSISNFHNVSSMYSCAVHFKKKNGGTSTIIKKGELPCQLKESKGHISIVWDAHIRNVKNLKYPLEYFVVINQKVDRKSMGVIIGESIKIVSEI